MKKRLHIVDLIGSYCGMHYYDVAFAELMRKYGFEVEIVSNFAEKGKPFFPRIFGRNKLLSLFLLLQCFAILLIHITKHKKDVFVYMCYGEIYDLLMMLPNLWNKNIYSDIHEVYALRYADNSKMSNVFKWYYTKIVRHFIYHSDRTKDILKEMGVEVPMLCVPHFKYNFKKDFDANSISTDLTCVFHSNRIKFLFFGNLSVVKGTDTVINVFCNLSDNQKERVELVVAGKNVDNIDFYDLITASEHYKVFDRHINDDELVYLYKNTDFVLLPYKKSSQSGVFAMAAYFRKPMLLSDIPYFRKMLMRFPSFGIISSLDEFKESIANIIDRKNFNFYQLDELESFEMKKEIQEFAINFMNDTTNK